MKRSTLIMTLLAAVAATGCSGPSRTLSSISITGLPPILVPMGTVQLTATGNYSDNSTRDVTNSAVWSSSNTNIATVSGGLVTARALGPVSITCTFEGKSAAVALNVGAQVTANPGGPYQVIHDTNVTLDGLGSTSSPFPISRYIWNCGQSIQSNCDQEGARPVFRYRKCFTAPSTPTCTSGSGSTGIATYTVRLTVIDTQGNSSDPRTTTITVQNQY